MLEVFRLLNGFSYIGTCCIFHIYSKETARNGLSLDHVDVSEILGNLHTLIVKELHGIVCHKML